MKKTQDLPGSIYAIERPVTKAEKLALSKIIKEYQQKKRKKR